MTETGKGEVKRDNSMGNGGMSTAGANGRDSAAMSSECDVQIEDLGGIDDLSLTLPKGISVLAGKNSTNRSSLLQSIAAGLGGNRSAATLKTDAENGRVELNFDGDTYHRTVTRQGRSVQQNGDPYSDKPELVDTFVSLFATNEARRAVARGEDLRDILMRPVDVTEIRRRIETLKSDQSSLEEKISRIERDEDKLPELEEKRRSLEDDLDEIEHEIERLETAIEEFEPTDDTPDEVEEYREELTSLRSTLSDADSDFDIIEQKLEFRREECSELREEREALESERSGLSQPDNIEAEISELGAEISRLQNHRHDLESAVEDLQTVIQVNENLLEGNLETLGVASEDDVTSALDPESQTVECWTCGTDVERGQIADRIDTLRGIVSEQRSEISGIEERISERTDEKDEYENRRDRYEHVRERLEEIDEQITRHEERISELESDREDKRAELADLEEQIADVESEIEELDRGDEAEEQDEFIATHQELSKHERQRGRLENKLEDVSQRIEEIEQLREQRLEAENELSDVNETVAQLRGRIETRERELVDTLNTMMEDLVDLLQYRNIARVWVERRKSDDDSPSEFELHIVREGADGSIYEDSIETLSESEREVIGLVVGLAGFLVHDIDREIPFILLDSVEMIDANRMSVLLDYILAETDVQFLVVALLTKDAQAVVDSDRMPEHSIMEASRFD